MKYEYFYSGDTLLVYWALGQRGVIFGHAARGNYKQRAGVRVHGFPLDRHAAWQHRNVSAFSRVLPVIIDQDLTLSIHDLFPQ